MLPRSVVIQGLGSLSVQYDAEYFTPEDVQPSPRSFSQLYDILSDNSKVGRLPMPMGRAESGLNRVKVLYSLEPKNFTYTKRLLRYPHGNFSFVFGNDPEVFPRYWFKGSYYSFATTVVTTDAISALQERAENRLKSRFFAKLKSSEFDLAITLAERQKTFVMIAHRAALLTNIKSFFKAFWKRVRGRSIQRHESIAQAVANAWLEYQYGWRQLASDIFAIASFSAKKSMNRHVKTRVGVENTEDRGFEDPNSGILILATEKQSVLAEMKIKVTLDADPVLDLTRLSTLNPIAIAWELLPFSFVFDWIMDISTYLAELQTRVMFDSFLGGGYYTYVHKYELDGVIKQQKGVGTSYCVTVDQDILLRDEWTRLTRTKFATAPLPNFPLLRSPVSIHHALTTLTLVVQRMKPKHLGRSGRYQ